MKDWPDDVFTQGERIWRESQGWCSLEKAHTLMSLIISHRMTAVIEIGVWHGKSLLPMAIAAQAVGAGVAAIDPWSSSASVAGQGTADAAWWNRQEIHEAALAEFTKKLRQYNLMENVGVIRKRSSEVDPVECDLLHVDGNHGAQAVEDMQRFAPKVRPGGFVVADDINWTGGEVAKAIDILPSLGFVKLYDVLKEAKPPYYPYSDNWAVFQRSYAATGPAEKSQV